MGRSSTRGTTRNPLQVAFGDLTVFEAERIMREHGIDDEDGATRLARVYAVLDTGSPALDSGNPVVGVEDVAVGSPCVS